MGATFATSTFANGVLAIGKTYALKKIGLIFTSCFVFDQYYPNDFSSFSL